MARQELSEEEAKEYVQEIILEKRSTFIPELIKYAKSGCINSAKSLISITSDYFQTGRDIPIALKTYLAEVFQVIDNGESADKALYLKHRRGKNNSALHKKRAIALTVLGLIALDLAKTVEGACNIVFKLGAIYIHVDDSKFIFVDTKTAYKYFYEIYPGKLNDHIGEFNNWSKESSIGILFVHHLNIIYNDNKESKLLALQTAYPGQKIRSLLGPES